MKQLFILLSAALIVSCSDLKVLEPNDYACYALQTDSSSLHPMDQLFQQLITEKISKGLPGINVSLRTPDGHVWNGAGGRADLANDVMLNPCHQMMIASISKVFTATCIFKLQEDGLLKLNDKLSDHLDGPYMDKIRNAEVVTIRQLLNHTSGLYDYLDPLKYELISINEPFKSDSPADKLKLAYGKKPVNEPGETYYYSNTNYVLLGLLVEHLTGKSLSAYEKQVIFDPMQLSSAFAGTTDQPLPPGIPKGYLSINANDALMESEFYYHYDLATGDGNIGITMSELGLFMHALHEGRIIGTESLAAMKETAVLPEDWQDEYHKQNGQGLEIFETPYGTAYGHTGAIVGFLSTAWYFPESGTWVMFSTNGVSPLVFEQREAFTREILELVFDGE
ncbi:MAG: beta-lactamase family protein [Cyclobacteriaceae bacterium]